MRPFEYDGEEMTTYNILLGIVRDKLRPEIPPNHELLGGPCPVYKEYVQLMEECWDQDPETRPTFSEIHERLQVMKRKTVELRKEQEPSSPRVVARSIKTVSRHHSCLMKVGLLPLLLFRDLPDRHLLNQRLPDHHAANRPFPGDRCRNLLRPAPI